MATKKEKLTLNTLVGDALNLDNSKSSGENVNQMSIARIEGTPFDIKKEGGKMAICVGKWTVSQVLEESEENLERLLDLVRRRDWMLIVTLVGALTEVNNEYKELSNER